MSVTTTANQTVYNSVNVLSDYQLHHSRSSSSLSSSSYTAPRPNRNPNPAAGHQNPENWPTDRRRIPNYRPVNPNLDPSTRRVYLNNVERTFVTIMFAGVWTNGTAAKLWRRTGGRVWNIQYPIGGEV